MDIFIHPIPCFEDNYIWALIKEKNCLLVDPGDADVAINYIQSNNLNLNAILITHHHKDHTGGLSKLIELWPDTPVFGPRQTNNLYINNKLSDSDYATANKIGLNFNVIETPGHTLDHVIYYESHLGLLFCGDTLFGAGCGRLFEGNPSQMLESLNKIMQLPNSTKIFPAHEYTLKNLNFASDVEPQNSMIEQRLTNVKRLRSNELVTLPSTLKEEKFTNPFLRCKENSLKEFASKIKGSKVNDELTTFTIVRECRNSY